MVGTASKKENSVACRLSKPLNTQPIIVVDGVAMDNDISGDGGTDWGNQLKNLNPDDFKSISVLKGAAATALYGTRALHCVVIVLT